MEARPIRINDEAASMFRPHTVVLSCVIRHYRRSAHEGRLAILAMLLLACADSPTSPLGRSPQALRVPPPPVNWLFSVDNGRAVYDSLHKVTWLANANFAATQSFGLPGVDSSGSMDYATALAWVDSLNAMNAGAGYLGHNSWQLPTTPLDDGSCSSFNNGNFGFGCDSSMMGFLYNTAFRETEPASVAPWPNAAVGPFHHVQSYLYWSATQDTLNKSVKNGYNSFSFNNGFQGSNIDTNYLYVLPMIPGQMAGAPQPSGRGLELNPNGTVYDPIANVTWLADANLAAKLSFHISGIATDGAMTHTAALAWIDSLNARAYLGDTNWTLPPTTLPDTTCSQKSAFGFGCQQSPMGILYYEQLGLAVGHPVVGPLHDAVGLFRNLQPYLYWSCLGYTAGCIAAGPAANMGWSFTFGDGFQGTDVVQNRLYVMVYYPTPVPPPPPPHKPPPCPHGGCI